MKECSFCNNTGYYIAPIYAADDCNFGSPIIGEQKVKCYECAVKDKVDPKSQQAKKLDDSLPF